MLCGTSLIKFMLCGTILAHPSVRRDLTRYATPIQNSSGRGSIEPNNTWKPMGKFLTSSTKIAPKIVTKFFQKSKILTFSSIRRPQMASPRKKHNYYASNFGQNFNLRPFIWSPSSNDFWKDFHLT